jgi:hypothetical protein
MATQVKYVKILSSDHRHHNFQYKEGLNVDILPFNYDTICGAGGLYFTTIEHVYKFLEYGPYIADVEIPEDAQVVHLNDKSKADKIIITNIRRWENVLNIHDAVIANHVNIIFITNQTEELHSLVDKCGCIAFKYCNNPSPISQLNAVNANSNNIRHIANPSEEVKRVAITNNPATLRYITNPSIENIMDCLNLDGKSITYVKNPSYDMYVAAVKQNGCAIRYIKDPSEELQILAVKQNSQAYDYIKNPSNKVLDMVGK